jgi:hypothetical protein
MTRGEGCGAGGAGAEGAVVARRLLEMDSTQNLNGLMGWNAQTGEYEDMVKAGIIDPVKVRILQAGIISWHLSPIPWWYHLGTSFSHTVPF